MVDEKYLILGLFWCKQNKLLLTCNTMLLHEHVCDIIHMKKTIHAERNCLVLKYLDIFSQSFISCAAFSSFNNNIFVFKFRNTHQSVPYAVLYHICISFPERLLSVSIIFRLLSADSIHSGEAYMVEC